MTIEMGRRERPCTLAGEAVVWPLLNPANRSPVEATFRSRED
jgi:hypothetical protein